MADTIRVMAGDTEPIEITIDAEGLDNLDALNAAVLFMTEEDASTPHVNGAALTVADSALKKLLFDPTGNGPGGADAFATGAQGVYEGYVRATWNDGDVTRHRAKDGTKPLRIVVEANQE